MPASCPSEHLNVNLIMVRITAALFSGRCHLQAGQMLVFLFSKKLTMFQWKMLHVIVPAVLFSSRHSEASNCILDWLTDELRGHVAMVPAVKRFYKSRKDSKGLTLLARWV